MFKIRILQIKDANTDLLYVDVFLLFVNRVEKKKKVLKMKTKKIPPTMNCVFSLSHKWIKNNSTEMKIKNVKWKNILTMKKELFHFVTQMKKK